MEGIEKQKKFKEERIKDMKEEDKEKRTPTEIKAKKKNWKSN